MSLPGAKEQLWHVDGEHLYTSEPDLACYGSTDQVDHPHLSHCRHHRHCHRNDALTLPDIPGQIFQRQHRNPTRTLPQCLCPLGWCWGKYYFKKVRPEDHGMLRQITNLRGIASYVDSWRLEEEESMMIESRKQCWLRTWCCLPFHSTEKITSQTLML